METMKSLIEHNWRWLKQTALTDSVTPVTPLGIALAKIFFPCPNPYIVDVTWICIWQFGWQFLGQVSESSLFLKDEDSKTNTT